MMLASQGRAFTEALLWLYRSRGDHKKVLSALTEDKCVGAGELRFVEQILVVYRAAGVVVVPIVSWRLASHLQ
jgi:hypothetical protein